MLIFKLIFNLPQPHSDHFRETIEWEQSWIPDKMIRSYTIPSPSLLIPFEFVQHFVPFNKKHIRTRRQTPIPPRLLEYMSRLQYTKGWISASFDGILGSQVSPMSPIQSCWDNNGRNIWQMNFRTWYTSYTITSSSSCRSSEDTIAFPFPFPNALFRLYVWIFSPNGLNETASFSTRFKNSSSFL